MKGVAVSFSAIRDQVKVVFPNDLNDYGTLFGGRVLDLCDRLAGIVAKRHSRRICVTLGIDSVRFLAPAVHGDILIFKSSINRVWKTSMEVGVSVVKEDYRTGDRIHIVSAYFTFVALNDEFKPVEICPVIPETEKEKKRFEDAEARRQIRLSTKRSS
jgi:acyl-CoA hydrolase